MRTSALVIAIATAVAFASPAHDALAQGKGTEGAPGPAPTDAPGNAPSVRPSDRPGGSGAGSGGRSTPAESEPAPVVRDEPAAPPERWNSAAAAIWHVKGR